MRVRLSSPLILSRAVGVLALVLLGWAFAIGEGQPKSGTDTGAINGTVIDQTQAVVTGAKAVLTSAAGEKRESQTDDKGAYSFTGLKAGAYALTITAPNFAPKTFDNVALTAGLELTLDAQLEPASGKTEDNGESSRAGK